MDLTLAECEKAEDCFTINPLTDLIRVNTDGEHERRRLATDDVADMFYSYKS